MPGVAVVAARWLLTTFIGDMLRLVAPILVGLLILVIVAGQSLGLSSMSSPNARGEFYRPLLTTVALRTTQEVQRDAAGRPILDEHGELILLPVPEDQLTDPAGHDPAGLPHGAGRCPHRLQPAARLRIRGGCDPAAGRPDAAARPAGGRPAPLPLDPASRHRPRQVADGAGLRPPRAGRGGAAAAADAGGPAAGGAAVRRRGQRLRRRGPDRRLPLGRRERGGRRQRRLPAPGRGLLAGDGPLPGRPARLATLPGRPATRMWRPGCRRARAAAARPSRSRPVPPEPSCVQPELRTVDQPDRPLRVGRGGDDLPGHAALVAPARPAAPPGLSRRLVRLPGLDERTGAADQRAGSGHPARRRPAGHAGRQRALQPHRGDPLRARPARQTLRLRRAGRLTNPESAALRLQRTGPVGLRPGRLPAPARGGRPVRRDHRPGGAGPAAHRPPAGRSGLLRHRPPRAPTASPTSASTSAAAR